MYSAIKYDNTVYITYIISYYALYGENIFLIDLDRYIYYCLSYLYSFEE